MLSFLIMKKVNQKISITQPRKARLRKPTKTISGVAPLAVMLPPRKCEHGACLYCPTLNAPQSYTPKSPAVLRAASVDYDAWKQVKTRLEMFKGMGHPTDKIELIVMGGTFLQYPVEFQEQFIKDCFDALNDKKSKNLEEAKKLNETAQNRCVALCLETRPDWCTDKDIERMLEFGCTRVELGVQAIDDKIYEKVNRGHKVRDVVDSTLRLKRAGFKIGYHLMPGIPGSNPKKDFKMYKKLFSDSRFKPDQVKIYPCQVLKGSALEERYYSGDYVPYSRKQVIDLIIKMLQKTPRYCRVMRILREIPPSFLVAGLIRIDLRKDIEEEIRKKKMKIKEIRFREMGFAMRDGRKINHDLKIKVSKYNASKGKEYFIEVVNKDDLLFGLLRLRIENKEAIVRELHVYGPALNLGVEGKLGQHRGLGEKLMSRAEEIVRKKGIKNLKVISGVGVREYYKKLGYSLDKKKIYVEKSF
jgi:elongator complex protein 3